MTYARWACVLMVCAVVAGCGRKPTGGHELPPITDVTRIEITKGAVLQRIKIIRDREEVERLLAYVNGLSSGWEEPRFGAPVARLEVYFKAGQKIRGVFGVGPGFFITRADDRYFSQEVWDGEMHRFLSAAGMPHSSIEEYDLHNPRPKPRWAD